MNFSDAICFGKTASSKKKRIINDLKRKRKRVLTYLVTCDSENSIEMYHNAVLLSGEIDTSDITVIGIGETKAEGFEVIREIIEKNVDQYS